MQQLKLLGTIFIYLFLIGRHAVFAQKGETIYNQSCKMCHEGLSKEAPQLSSLQKLQKDYIIKTLKSGVMKIQGSMLSNAQIEDVSQFIAGNNHKNSQTEYCKDLSPKNKKVRVSNWGFETNNSRALASELNDKNISKLQLNWSFGFPEATRARCQPTIAGNTLLTASQQGVIYALDIQKGCIQWKYEAEAEVRSAIQIASDAQGNAKTIYFSDFNANIYAVDFLTRKLLWKIKADQHSNATITGSIAMHQNILYVPISSTEVLSAFNPAYKCCTFRGSVLALNAKDGSVKWKTYMIDSTAKPQSGMPLYGPSGAPVWGSPSLDLKRNCLYVGTGENYSMPSTNRSDAIVSIDLNDGKILWSYQATENDAWNAACVNKGINCPTPTGPDYDFGAPPIIKNDVLFAGQKSGMVYALDANNSGQPIWQTKVGRGGIMGGVHWGMASNDTILYVPINDREAYPSDSAKPSQKGLHALHMKSGKKIWTYNAPTRCQGTEKWGCGEGISAPITLTNNLIITGTLDGYIEIINAIDGKKLWTYNCNTSFETTNHLKANGGAIDGAGAVVVGDYLFINSGYAKFNEKEGNVLLCFKLKK